MAHELEHIDDPGLTIYAKPLPLVESPWATDAIILAEVAATGYYSANVATPAQTYLVFQQSGGTPAIGDAPPVAAIDRTPAEILADTAANLDTPVGTRLAGAAYQSPDNAGIASIKSKTDNLPNNPADVSDIPTTADIEAALLNEGDGQQLIDAILTVINNNLDVPALELQAIAQQVRAELSTELARLDATISSRLAAASYAAPDNATLAAIAALMPSDGRKIAGEGDTAKNLDQVQPGTLYVGTVVVSTPASSPAAISIVRGDTYQHTDGRAFHFASASWPNLTGATVTFSATSRATGQTDIAGVAMTVVTSEVIRLELSSAHTDGLDLGSAAYSFDIQATLATGSKVTLTTGTINVARDHST